MSVYGAYQLPRPLPLLFCLLYAATAPGQEIKGLEGRYFVLGAAVPLFAMRDEGHSSMNYHGAGIRFDIGYQRISEHGLFRLDFSLINGDLHTHPYPKANRKLHCGIDYVEFGAGYYRQVLRPGDNTAVYAGGSVSTRAHSTQYYALQNNVRGYEWTLSLNSGSAVRHLFGLAGHPSALSYQLSAPLLAYTMRPNYMGMAPFRQLNPVFSPGRMLKSGVLTSLHRYLHLQSELTLDRSDNKIGHVARLLGRWDYHYNYTGRPLKYSATYLGFNGLFRI